MAKAKLHWIYTDVALLTYIRSVSNHPENPRNNEKSSADL